MTGIMISRMIRVRHEGLAFPDRLFSVACGVYFIAPCNKIIDKYLEVDFFIVYYKYLLIRHFGSPQSLS